MDTESENSDKDFTSDDSVNSSNSSLGFQMGGNMVNVKTKQYRCMLVGDMGVGKTSLLASHATGKFPGEHVPTVFGNFVGMYNLKRCLDIPGIIKIGIFNEKSFTFNDTLYVHNLIKMF